LGTKIGFWLQQKVLVKCKGGYCVAQSIERGEEVVEMEEEEEEGLEDEAEKEKVANIEGYISGMLTNLGALPLDRIINMLKMFAEGEVMTEESVRKVLRGMKEKELVEDNGGVWSKVKV